MSAVVVSGLEVRYGDLVAVDGLSLTAEAGQITALLGLDLVAGLEGTPHILREGIDACPHLVAPRRRGSRLGVEAVQTLDVSPIDVLAGE